MNKDIKEYDLKFEKMWNDALDADSMDALLAKYPQRQADDMVKLYMLAHMSPKELINLYGSQNDFAHHFCINKRTVENWCAQRSQGIPSYVRLAICREMRLV